LKKIILVTGTSGFLGKIFLHDVLKKDKYLIVDILRSKNKRNKDLNILRKRFSKSYKSIFFKNNNEIKKKLQNLKVDYFINFATLYKNSHKHAEISNFINSNITFPTTVLDLVYMKVKKIINFGTMMQHEDGKNYIPKNFYASTKSALEMIINYYKFTNKKLKFYNVKFYESFSESDDRIKLIPELVKNYKKNIKTTIISKNLELNIIHANDIIKSIYIFLNNNVKSGSYCLKQKKNIKISNLINKINKNLNKKIKIKYLNDKFDKIKNSKIKPLNNWKPDRLLEQKIKKKIINENI
jgi:nucleoside-diphosphate-sugar epimerase